MPRLYLGIDGGQSSTQALIANEFGRIMGRGRGGPCNHTCTSEGHDKFFAAIGGCLKEACLEAGVDEQHVTFASACLGFSGGPDDKERFSRELIRSSKFKITHDAEIALSGASAGEPGIIVIAGTGSMAFGRNAAGETARAGGWGYIFGDEGGAFDITRRALRASLQAEEHWGPPTLLRRLLLDATRTGSMNDLLHRFYTPEYPRAAIAALAPLVTRAAEAEDDIALKILRQAAARLVWFVEGAYKTLFRSSERIPVAYTGGVFQSEFVRNEFIARIRERLVCRAVPPRFNPAAGAVLDALRLDGNPSELSNVPESEK